MVICILSVLFYSIFGSFISPIFLRYVNSAAHTIAMDICSEIEWYKGNISFLTVLFFNLALVLCFVPVYEVHVSVCSTFHD